MSLLGVCLIYVIFYVAGQQFDCRTNYSLQNIHHPFFSGHMQVRRLFLRLVHCDWDTERSFVSPEILHCSLLVFSGMLQLVCLCGPSGRFDLRPLALSEDFHRIRMDPEFSRGSAGISMRGRLWSSRSVLSAVVVCQSEEIHQCLEHSSSSSAT